MDILPVGSPVKCVKFNEDESSEKMVGASRLTKVLRSDFGLSDRTVTSAAVCPLILDCPISTLWLVSVVCLAKLGYLEFQLGLRVLTCCH